MSTELKETFQNTPWAGLHGLRVARIKADDYTDESASKSSTVYSTTLHKQAKQTVLAGPMQCIHAVGAGLGFHSPSPVVESEVRWWVFFLLFHFLSTSEVTSVKVTITVKNGRAVT